MPLPGPPADIADDEVIERLVRGLDEQPGLGAEMPEHLRLRDARPDSDFTRRHIAEAALREQFPRGSTSDLIAAGLRRERGAAVSITRSFLPTRPRARNRARRRPARAQPPIS